MSLTDLLLRDEFDVPVAAGAINNTLSTDGVNTRLAIDVNSKMSIGSGILSIASGGSASFDPTLIYSQTVTRQAGTILLVKLLSTQRLDGGFLTSKTLTTSSVSTSRNSRFSRESSTLYLDSSIGRQSVAALSSTNYTIFLALTSSGEMYFVQGNEYTYPTLLFRSSLYSTASLYPFVSGVTTTSTPSSDFVRVAGYWLPVPLVSDGFGSAFGTSDGLGHAETSGLGSGGSGVVWTQRVGTWTVSGGKAQASALSGGIAIATAASSTTDQFFGLDITRSAGDIGIILRYTDASNYVRAVHNGTNLQVIKKVAGTDTTVINAAATYSAGKKIWIWTNGPATRAYFNDALIGSATISDSVLQSGVVGIYTSDLNNTGDNFVAYAVGTGGEYASVFDIGVSAVSAMSGIGTMSADATITRNATLALTGSTIMSAGLSVDSSLRLAAELALTGSTTMSATLSSIKNAELALTGSTVMSATVQTIKRAELGLSGTSTMHIHNFTKSSSIRSPGHTATIYS